MTTHSKNISPRRAQQAIETFYAPELEQYRKIASSLYTFQDLCSQLNTLLEKLFTERDHLNDQGISRAMLIDRIEMTAQVEYLVRTRSTQNTAPSNTNTPVQDENQGDNIRTSTDNDEYNDSATTDSETDSHPLPVSSDSEYEGFPH
ncbi:hypothetical protein [Actinotignum urinale]|uniref:hypothetical protein n=1 Tax=Actinotignum urinale TaxID=190146 RepID=UPI00370DAB12